MRTAVVSRCRKINLLRTPPRPICFRQVRADSAPSGLTRVGRECQTSSATSSGHQPRTFRGVHLSSTRDHAIMASLRLHSLYHLLCLLLATGLVLAQSAATLPKSITLSYESLLPESQSVKPLATIFYDPDTLKSSISSWTPPSTDSLRSTTAEPVSPQLLRILLPSGSSALTSLGTFNNSLNQNIDLHLSPVGDGSVLFASVYASTPIVEVLPSGSKSKTKAKKLAEAQKNAKDNTDVQVKVMGTIPGVTPKLVSKKPPVVGADGREQPAPEEVEKSFFQKYWWIFAVVALLSMAGGGDK